MPAPDGSTISLKFDHAVDHGDGNWTWIGRPAGTKPGTEAIITFGPKAVFGTVPYGRKPALRISSAQGRTFLMETDPVKLARLDNVGRRPTGPDAVAPPPALTAARDKVLARAAAQPKAQSLVASAAAPESNTVDVVVGYTNGFASRLGGQSQAVTRLTHLVAVTNQAFTNSQINGRGAPGGHGPGDLSGRHQQRNRVARTQWRDLHRVGQRQPQLQCRARSPQRCSRWSPRAKTCAPT